VLWRPSSSAAPRACSHVGRVCWHSPSCRVVHLGSDAPSTAPPLAAKGHRHACIASMQGHHNSLSLCRLLPRVHELLAWCVRALAAKAEPSRPSHPPSAHAAIKGAFPVHFVRATGFSAPISATSSPSPDLTNLPLSSSVGLRAPTHHRTASRGVVDYPRPPEPSGTVDHADEFCPSVTRLPRFELGLPTMSDECTVG
jgi:hypothetical protein